MPATASATSSSSGAATAFDNFKVVPPGTGICHQVNLEHIAQGVWTGEDQNGETVAYPDTLVGTDSHTTMVNGLGVLGWGVGGIEAEAAMLGQPVSMLIPEVVGFRLSGALKEGITATDLVLTVTQMLRAKGVVGRFVEFYGPGLDAHEPRRPRDHRQHGARIWRDLRLLPDRRADDRISAADRPRRRPDRAGPRLCPGAGHVARRRRRPSRCSPTRSSSTWPRSSRRSPGPKRPQDRVLLGDVDDQFNAELEHTYKKHNDPRVAVEGEDSTSAMATS